MSAPELKPCPFCGSEAETMDGYDGPKSLAKCPRWVQRPQGKSCPAAYHFVPVAVWNRRAETRGAAGSTEAGGEGARASAWLSCGPYSEMKRCPWCGSLALEGQVSCTGCGHEPGDDMTWRKERAAGRAATADDLRRTMAHTAPPPSTSPAEFVREEGEDLKDLIWRLDARWLADHDALIAEAADALRSRLAREHEGEQEPADLDADWFVDAIARAREDDPSVGIFGASDDEGLARLLATIIADDYGPLYARPTASTSTEEGGK